MRKILLIFISQLYRPSPIVSAAMNAVMLWPLFVFVCCSCPYIYLFLVVLVFAAATVLLPTAVAVAVLEVVVALVVTLLHTPRRQLYPCFVS